jgi:asparagine synthase (glutamine-hydrolysing)
MCGFTGCFFPKSKSIEKNFDPIPLHHRGPDDFQSYESNFAKINFYRLKILGGPHGTQPMISENKNWLMVFNGCIYNYIELAKEIGRPDLIRKGDSRVLLELLSLKGFSYLKKLNGMFSIVLINIKKKKIYLIRDRFGIKPLYFHINNNAIYFSSEIKSISNADKLKIDAEQINKFLESELYPETPTTFFKGIYEIKPGTINEFKKNKLKIKKFYDLEKRIKKLENKKLCLKDFEKIFEKSIRLRLRSDVPISLHFSGGIDSTAILCKLREIYKKKFPVKIYFINYGGKNNLDLLRAKKITNILKLKLKVVNFTKANIKQEAQKVQYFMDEPYGGVPLLGMNVLNKIGKKNNIPVSLEGQGSDEIFAGYFSHIVLLMKDLLSNNKDKVILNKLKKNFKLDDKTILKTTKILIKNNFGGSTDISKVVGSPIKIKKYKTNLKTIEFFNIFYNKLPRVLRFHDRISAGHSRELRFPFLDHNLVEYALALKNKYRFQDGWPKFPLLNLINKHIPKLIFEEKKRSNNIDEKQILLNNKKWVLKNIKELKEIKQIKKKYFVKFNKNFTNKKITNSFHLWQLININIFLQNVKKLKIK